MTMTPKPKKFRLRSPRDEKPAPPAPAAQEGMFDDHDDGFGDTDFRQPAPQAPPPKTARSPAKTARPAAPQKGGEELVNVEQQLAKIRAEGLTGRQLRMARRVAQKHGVKFSSDYDAVRQLRDRGIDPFARSNMLELVGAQDADENLPAELKQAPPPAPSAAAGLDDAERAREIMAIQRDIARRRKRRSALLSARLFFFVGIPTLIAAFYFYVLATPMYATKSEFVIQQSNGASSSGASGLAGLFSGSPLANSQDSISVQSYLLSREALARLDADHGFTRHFSDPRIDALQRLETDATREAAYALYLRTIKIGYDPSEGLIKMEVMAADPATSQAFSEALIRYAEEDVDQMTARLRADQMKGAAESLGDAEARLRQAQNRVVELQEQLGVVSAEAEISSRMTQVATVENRLREERLRLDRLMANSRPNQTRVQVIEGNIERLDRELTELRSGLTDGGTGTASLARISAELGVAEIELQTRTALVQQAATQLETARIEANRQVRYLSNSVPPIAPDEPTYPRSFENTLLAFMVFCGIYLMISITASVLREQA